ncbi:hypothetical protein [Spongiimicrobium sp. 3-5]|uniref:hypothetical protein n=1 Tax=Spongiimicrobium sp. 3-5 TaxID=3332596 RepID=UPI00397F5F65
MNYTIYILLAVFGLVFFVTLIKNRKNAKRRKSRKFMDGYTGSDKKRQDNE